MNAKDCIVGVATGTPDGGVSVLRLSGGVCESVGKQLLGTLPQPRMAGLRGIRGPDDELLDEALVLWMPEPRSFTGEDVLELHIHAGRANVRQVLERCVHLGARMARPGEFSRRAFENQKLSLDQVEALPSLLAAESGFDLDRARRLLRGELGDRVDEISQKLFSLRVEIEAHLDFPEDVANVDGARWRSQVLDIRTLLGRWLHSQDLQSQRAGRCRVVIAGPPNAGKSSLFNALVEQERSIVSDQAGTTRDYVESSLRWRGVSFDLVDTAGIRNNADKIEAQGIAMGRREIVGADLVLWLSPDDESSMTDDLLLAGLDPHQVLRVNSKADLSTASENSLAVSVRPGFEASVELLRSRIQSQLDKWMRSAGDDWVGLERHAKCVRETVIELEKVDALLGESDLQLEIVAFHLGSAVELLGDIRGRERLRPIGEGVLNAIFSNFCIGK